MSDNYTESLPGPPEAHDAYDDDALADALAKELHTLTTGSIKIIVLEQVATPEPKPEPEPEPAAAAEIEPEKLPLVPPARTALGDSALLSNLTLLDESVLDTASRLNVMQRLEEQMKIRADEAREFARWSDSVRAVGTPEALASLARAESEFLRLVVPAALNPDLWVDVIDSDPTDISLIEISAIPTQPAVIDQLIEPAAQVIESATPRTSAFWQSIVPSASDFVLNQPAPPAGIVPAAPQLFEPSAFAPRVAGNPDANFPVLSTLAVAPEPSVSPIVVVPSVIEPTEVLRSSEVPRSSENQDSADLAKPAGPAPGRYPSGSRSFFLWFGFSSSVLSLPFGAALLLFGLSFVQTVIAAVLGVGLAFVPQLVESISALRTGQPSMIFSRATFGFRGNVVVATVVVLARAGWAAVLLWLLASSTAHLAVSSGVISSMTDLQFETIVLAVAFVIVIVVAYLGLRVLVAVQTVLSVIAGVLVIALIVFTIPAVNFDKAFAVAPGSWQLTVAATILVFVVAGLAWVGSHGDLSATRLMASEPNTARNSAGHVRRWPVALWLGLGSVIPPLLLVGYGSLLVASSAGIGQRGPIGAQSNPLDALIAVIPGWFLFPLIAAIFLSLLAGAINAVFSGGVTLRGLADGLPRAASTLIFSVLAVCGAVLLLVVQPTAGFAVGLREAIVTVAVPLAAVVGILTADLVLRRGRIDPTALIVRHKVYPDANWANLAGFGAATAIGFGLNGATTTWLGWQGYLFLALGLPTTSPLASIGPASTGPASIGLGVVAALCFGLLTPIVFGYSRLRRESAGISRR